MSCKFAGTQRAAGAASGCAHAAPSHLSLVAIVVCVPRVPVAVAARPQDTLFHRRYLKLVPTAMIYSKFGLSLYEEHIVVPLCDGHNHIIKLPMRTVILAINIQYNILVPAVDHINFILTPILPSKTFKRDLGKTIFET